MLLNKLKPYKIILASKSPRRHALMKGAGIDFDILSIDTDETFPNHLKTYNIPLYLSKKKADAVCMPIDDFTIIITADTIVWLNNEVVNKPDNKDDAISMIKS